MENTNMQLTMTMRDDVGSEATTNLTPKMVEAFENMGVEAPYKMTALKNEEDKWVVEVRTKD